MQINKNKFILIYLASKYFETMRIVKINKDFMNKNMLHYTVILNLHFFQEIINIDIRKENLNYCSN